jgi:transcriptional regulator with XRE-family HTH domain
MEHVGKKMKMFSEQSTLSIGEIAQKMGTTYQNLYKIFGKESIDSRHLINLSKVLGIPVSHFFEEESRDDLINEIKSLRILLQSKDETIAQLQNQNSILNKLVIANDEVIRKQGEIDRLMKRIGRPDMKIDPSNPNFEKFYKFASGINDGEFLVHLIAELLKNPRLNEAFKKYLKKKAR